MQIHRKQDLKKKNLSDDAGIVLGSGHKVHSVNEIFKKSQF